MQKKQRLLVARPKLLSLTQVAAMVQKRKSLATTCLRQWRARVRRHLQRRARVRRHLQRKSSNRTFCFIQVLPRCMFFSQCWPLTLH